MPNSQLAHLIPLASVDPAPVGVVTGQLVDSFGRHIEDMRVSITDRCNFRCVYCMPEEGLQWLKRDTLLTFDEITRLCQIAVKLGVRELRLTGGEPTLRPGLAGLIRQIKA